MKGKLSLMSGQEGEFKALLLECARYCKGSEELLIGKRPALFSLLSLKEFQNESMAKEILSKNLNPFGYRFKLDEKEYPNASPAVLKLAQDWITDSKSKRLKYEMEKSQKECDEKTKSVAKLQEKFLAAGYTQRVSDAYSQSLYYEANNIQQYGISSNLSTYQGAKQLVSEFEKERDEYVRQSSLLKEKLYLECAESKKKYLDDLFETEERVQNLLIKKELTLGDSKKVFLRTNLNEEDQRKIEKVYPDLYLFTEEKRDQDANEKILTLHNSYQPAMDVILDGSFYQQSSVNINFKKIIQERREENDCNWRDVLLGFLTRQEWHCNIVVHFNPIETAVSFVINPGQFAKDVKKDLKDIVKSVKETPRKVGREAERGGKRVGKEAERTVHHVGDAVEDGVRLTKAALAKAEREGFRLSADAVHLQRAAILGAIHPITKQSKTLQAVDRILDHGFNLELLVINAGTTSITDPTTRFNINNYRNYFNGVKEELSGIAHEGIALQNKALSKFGDEFVRRISPDLGHALEEYIKAIEKGEKVANAIVTFENTVRIAAVTAGSFCFAPVGSAVANVMVDKFVLKKSMTEKDMLKSFAIGLAAGIAASGATFSTNSIYLQNLQQTVQKDLTTALAKKITYNDNYTEKEFLIDLISAGVMIASTGANGKANSPEEARAIILKKAAVAAGNSASSNLVNQAVNTKKLNTSQIYEAALAGAGNSILEDNISPYTKPIGKNIEDALSPYTTPITDPMKEKIIGLYVGLKETMGFGAEATKVVANNAYDKLEEKEKKELDQEVEKSVDSAIKRTRARVFKDKNNSGKLTLEESTNLEFSKALQEELEKTSFEKNSPIGKKIERSIASITNEPNSTASDGLTKLGQNAKEQVSKAAVIAADFLQQRKVQQALMYIEVASIGATVLSLEVATAGAATPFIATYLVARYGPLTLMEGAAIIKATRALTLTRRTETVETLKAIDKGAESAGDVARVLEVAGKLGIKTQDEITEYASTIKKISENSRGSSHLNTPVIEYFEDIVATSGKEGYDLVKGIPSLRYTGEGIWVLDAGIVYGKGSKDGNRLRHILLHRKPDPTKPKHNVFQGETKDIPRLIDEAWQKKGMSELNDPGAYIVPMGKVIGTQGETSLRIIVKPGTNEIITAYPH